jgi:Fuc2NAc and GlcNAc transferase
MMGLATIVTIILVAVLSWWALGYLIKVLVRKEIVDVPNERTLHQGAIPRGGGLVIVAALLAGLLLCTFFSGQFLFFGTLTLLMLAWATLSWVDDNRDLSPHLRLLIQLCLSAITIIAFGWVDSLLGIELAWLGVVLSLLGLVWMANLYNFMDGMDGLAGSQGVVASITLSFWFYISGATYLALLCLILSASSYGFVLRNWRPAQIFMGDVGSITLGAFFGTLIIIGVSRYDMSVLSFVSLFAVFIVDASVTILRRASKGEKIWLPHRQHYYQRLATAGYDHSKIVLAAVCLMVLCSVLATIGMAYHDMIMVSTISICVLLAAVLGVIHFLEKRGLSNPSKH